jgi:hypothetical protein
MVGSAQEVYRHAMTVIVLVSQSRLMTYCDLVLDHG